MATPVRFPLDFELHSGVPPLYRSARNEDYDTAMKTNCVDSTVAAKSPVLARVICFVLAIPLGLIGVFMTLIMLLANMNINFSSSPGLAMFLVGWAFVGSSFVATFRLLRRPCFKSLWYLAPPVICMAVVQWLETFRENQHLMH